VGPWWFLTACAGGPAPAPTPAPPPTGSAEYVATRSERDLQVALGSKAFAWWTGSAAADEALPLGKTAQFFGFEGLRAESGRAAQRGTLGRAFFAIATEEQRATLAAAALAEAEPVRAWWETRGEIVRLLRTTALTGTALPTAEVERLGGALGRANGRAAVAEAVAFAAVERTLTRDQRAALARLRADPGSADGSVPVTAPGLPPALRKPLEDLYAKAFAWLTGDAADQAVVPVGQPGQFFGFEALRLASGHAVNRARVADTTWALLDPTQRAVWERQIAAEVADVDAWLSAREGVVRRLDALRVGDGRFDAEAFLAAAEDLGRRDVAIAAGEAAAFAAVGATLSPAQRTALATERTGYALDPDEVRTLPPDERAARLWSLCAGCHAGGHAAGPPLAGVVGRPVASVESFSYSPALAALRGRVWTPERLDAWLAAPRDLAPGTAMGFTGLPDPEDRRLLIEALAAGRLP
jgi:cytochrome c2